MPILLGPEPGSLPETLCACLIVLLGLFVVGVGIRRKYQIWRSASWPKAQGRAVWTEDGKFLLFDFPVNGTQYRMAAPAFSTSNSSEREVFRLRYPDGAAAMIRYDPANAQTAIAETSQSVDSNFFLIFGLVLSGLGIWFGYSFNRWNLEIAMLTSAAALFLILGLLGVGYSLVTLGQSLRASRWPTTQGEIVHMRVDASASIDSRGRDSTSLYPNIAYRYMVNGKMYFSNQRRYGETGVPIQAVASNYPKGTRVKVFYSPKDPQIAVLEPGFALELLNWFFAGLAPIVFVVLFYVVMRFVGGGPFPD